MAGLTITTTRTRPDGSLAYFDGERELSIEEVASRMTPGTTAATEFAAKYPGIKIGSAATTGATGGQTAPAANSGAGLSNVSAPAQQQQAGPGAIDPATLQQLMAVYKANPSLVVKNSEGESGVTYQQAPGTTVNGYTIQLDPNTQQPIITRSVQNKTWGQDVAEVYGPDGQFQGYGSGDSTALGLTKFVAGAFGMYGAGVGLDQAINGAAAGGANSATSAAWQSGAGKGLDTVSAVGGGSQAGLDLVTGSGIGEGLGTTLTGSSTLTSGGTMPFGTQLADSSLLSSYGADALGGTGSGLFDIGGSAVNNLPGVNAPTGNGNGGNGSPGTTTPPAGNNGNNGNNGLPGGWQQLGALAGGALAAGAAGNALSNPVSTGKFDQLFNNLLTEQGNVSGRATDQWNSYTSTWKPVEQKYAQTVMNFDTPQRRETAANEAMNQVANQYDLQRQSSAENMARMGVDGSTIAMLGDASKIDEAKARAGAANQARSNVEQVGLNLLSNGANFGRNLVGSSLQASGVATGTAGTASNVAGTQANIQNQNTQNRNAMVGDLLGAGMQLYGMFGSSKKTKKVGKKVAGLDAVRAVEESPSKEWRYKDGEGDGDTKERMGPMAEVLDAVAPAVSDGKQVDVISMLGLHHAAIAQVAKDLRSLKHSKRATAEA